MANLANYDLSQPLINLAAQAGGGPFLSGVLSNEVGRGVMIVSNISVFGTSVIWEIRSWDPVTKTDMPMPITGGAVSATLAANAVTPLIMYPGITAFTAAATGAAYNMVLPKWWKLKCTIVGTVTAKATAQLIL